MSCILILAEVTRATPEYVMLGLVFALVNALTEVVRKFANVRSEKKNNAKGYIGNCSTCNQTSNRVTNMHEVMTRVDENGTPLVYAPRLLTQEVKELLQTTGKLVGSVDKLRDTLERQIRKET